MANIFAQILATFLAKSWVWQNLVANQSSPKEQTNLVQKSKENGS